MREVDEGKRGDQVPRPLEAEEGVRPFPPAALAAILVAATALAGDGAGAQRLLSYVEKGPAAVSSAQSTQHSARTNARRFDVQVDFDLLRKAPETLEVPTPYGTTVQARLAEFQDRGGGDFLWSGHAIDGNGDVAGVVVLTMVDGGIAGVFDEPGGTTLELHAVEANEAGEVLEPNWILDAFGLHEHDHDHDDHQCAIFTEPSPEMTDAGGVSAATATAAQVVSVGSAQSTLPGVTLSVSPAEVTEDAASPVEVIVTAGISGTDRFGADKTLRISVGGGTSASGTDYTAVPDFDLVIPAGGDEASATFDLHLVNDEIAEPHETIRIGGFLPGVNVTPAEIELQSDDRHRIDVVVLFTAFLRSRLPSIRTTMQRDTTLMFDYASRALQDAGAAAEYNVVHIGHAPLDLETALRSTRAIFALRDSRQAMRLRDEHDGDIIYLMGAGSGGIWDGGQAFWRHSAYPTIREYAWAGQNTTNYARAGRYRATAHELAHTLGGLHERGEPGQAVLLRTREPLAPYAYGYYNAQAEIRTILAYGTSRNPSSPAIYATPRRTWNGHQIGAVDREEVDRLLKRTAPETAYLSDWITPGPPTGIGGTASVNGGTASVALTWTDESSRETAQRIEYITPDRDPEESDEWATGATVDPNVTSASITGLLPATRYGFRIRALNHLRSYPSETAWVTTPGSGPPTRPSSLEASAPADRTIRLEWRDNSTTENGFDAQYRTYGASAWTAGPGAAPDAVTVDVTGLLDDTEYEFRVGATNTQGTSWSDVVIAHTNVPTAPPPPLRPQTPAELLGARLTSTSVRLEWSDLSTNETGFAVEVRPDGGGPTDWQVALTLPANVTETIVAGLPENAALEFRIAAMGAAASSRSDPLAIDLSVEPPPAAALTGRIKRVGQAIFADLRWTIDRKYKGEFRIWHKASTRPDWEIEPSWRSNRTRDARLTVPSYDRVLRTYRVETRSGGGRTFSNEIEIDFNNLPPAAVKKLTAAVASGIPTEVRLSWKTARNASGYRVSYTFKGKETVHAVYPSDATKAYVDGLEPGSYTFTVASLSRTGFTEAEKKFKLPKPANAPPKTAELLSVQHFGKNALQLRYKDRSTDEASFVSAIRADDGYWTYARVTTQDGPGDGGTSRGNWVVEPKTVYHLRVLAESTNGSLNSNIVTIYSSQDPGDVTVVPTGSTSVDVTWTDRANQETRFAVQYRGETGGWTTAATVKKNGTKASVDGLVAGARYRFRVRARIPYSFGDDYWDDSDVLIVTMPPPGPSGVTVTALDSTSATVQWTSSSTTETGFVIEARPAGDPNAEWSIHGAAAAGATTATATNLTPSATHEIRVLAAQADNGRSTPSDPATVTMPPPPPSGLTATSAGPTSVNLMWMDESTDETGFVASYRAEGAATWTVFATEANANATTLTVTGLTGGGNFEFQVRARSANGLSSPSNTARVTGLGAPAAATGLTATATGPTTVDLAWSDNSNDETGFDIEHRKNGLGAWTGAPGAAANDRAATVSGLAPSTVYEFRVNARNGSGAAPGAPVSVTMPPREPLQVAVQATDATSALITWVDRTRDETGFRVERRTGGGAWSVTETTDPDVQQATLAGLATSTPYDVRVTAVSATGESPGSVVSLTMPPAAPTGLAATEASPTSVTLTWMDSSPDEAGFIAEYRAARSGDPWTAYGTQAAANAMTITVSGLMSGTGYEFRVLAKSNAGPHTPSDPVSIDPLGGPTAPTNVMATALGSNGASVSWRDNSADETGFAVEYRLGADLWTTGATVGPNESSAAIGHLFGSRAYEFRVTATNAVGASSSAPATLTLPPPAPTELSASPASRTSVTLTWTDNSADENNFVIEYLAASSLAVALATSTDTEGAPTSGGPEGMTAGQTAATWTTFGTTAAADAETIAVTGLASDTPYAFRVSADHGTNGMSSPSNLVWLGSLGLPLAATGVTVQASGSTTVSVTWMDNSSDETGFAVQYRQPLGAWTTALTAGENARSATVTGLASSTAYEFRVNAMNENGPQPSAAVSLTMPPAAPTNLIAAPVSGTEVLLIWTDASTDETGFVVEYRESGQTAWTMFGSELPADTARVTVTGLVAGKGYRFRVFANHGTNGLSSPSNIESTLGVPAPAAPTGVSVTAAGSTSAVVSWTDASANEQGFRAQYRTGSDPWSNGATAGSNTASATVSGLAPSTAYDFRVEAYNSTAAVPSSVVSLVMPPAAPTGLSASAASATSVTLSWTDNSSDETSFAAEYRTTGVESWTVFGMEAPAGVTTLTVTGLVAGTAYEFRVYAKHGMNGLSSPSNVASVAGLLFSRSSINVTEGNSATYTVKLASQPTGNVTVTVSGHNGTDLSVDTDGTTPNDQTTLTFTTSNWNTAQTVTVSAAPDNDSDNETPITLAHTASGGGYNGVSGNVTVNIIDSSNPTVELSVSGAGAVTEGGTLTVTATVSRAPSGNLSVPVQRVAGNSSADGSDYSLPAITISSGATSGTATFTATNDAADEPDETLRLALGTVSGYDHGTSHRVDIVITDDDPTTVALSVPDATATEDSSSATATIRLTLGRGLISGEALAVPLSFTGGTAGTDFTLGLSASPAGVTFNAGTGTVTFTGPQAGATATAANVTLTASSDDDAEDRTVTVSIPSSSTGAAPILTATNLDGGATGSRSGNGQITITDDESKALTFSTSTVNVTEGGSATYTVKLATRPTAAVTVTVSGHGGTDLSVDTDSTTPNDQTTLTFTTSNWNSAQTVTVSATADADSDNEAPITLAHAASGGGYVGVSGDVTVNIIDSTAPVVLPTAPSGVTVTATGSTSVSVAWSDTSSNETGFTVEHRTGAGDWTSAATTAADAESAAVTGLLPSTAYDFRVLAVNVHGSSPSGAVSLTMPPAAPTGLVASSATNTSAALTWRDASTDETSFVVQYRAAGAQGWTTFATEAGANTTTLTVTGLAAGTSYEFRVFAKHSANGLSSPSNVASVGPTAPPAAPTGLTVTASGSTSVSVSWTDASTDETGFEVEYRTGSDPWATGATVEAGVTAATVTGLSPGAAYDFRVASVNANGRSPGFPTSLTMPPAAASDLDGTATDATSVTLTWTVNSVDETSFQVEYRPARTEEWTIFGTEFPAGATTAVVTGLAVGTSYDFRVYAKHSANGVSSTSETARVGAFGAPAPPVDVAAAPVGATSVRVTWTDVSSDETGFEVEYREANPGVWRKFGTEAGANAESLLVTGLLADTTYEFRVIAKSAAGLGRPSPASEAATEGRVTPPPPPPGPPLPPPPPPNRAPYFDPATPLLLTVVEGTTGAIGFVTADDPDGDDLSYRLSGAGRRFAIDADTGELSVRPGVTLDASARSSYEFTAVASDGELSASRDVTVEVVEPAPPGSDPVERAPAAPSGLQATILTSSVVLLTWADVADDETGYEVFRREGVGGWEQARTLPAEAETATVEELSAGIEYEFVVLAANRHGRAASDVAAIELSLAPPTHLDAAPLDETSVRVSWRDNSISETGFEVQIRPRARGDDSDDEADGTGAPGGTGTDGEGGAANGWTAAAAVGPDRTFAVLDGLEPGGRYLFRVGALGPGAPAFGRTGAFAVASVPAPGALTDCEPGETAAVLSGGYEARMCFEMPSGARVDASNYHLESTASGLLYFFDRDNVEVLVKVLDGCAINGHRWVFAAPVTDLAFNLEITERATGRTFSHRNPRGMTAATAGDAAAFPCDPATTAAARTVAAAGGAPPELPGPATGQPVPSAAAQGDNGSPEEPPVCEPEGPGIELEDGHRIDMCFQTPDGEVGRARDWGLRSRSSALLHFFDRENAEVLVKVLDGCNVNGHRWVFAAAATDLAFQLVVTAPDGQRWTHRNSDGDTAKPRADAAAFRCLQ